MPGKNVLCFGELLLRLCPDADGAWLRNGSLPVFIGGAEANVATALARWDIPVQYVTALPDHYVSAHALKELHKKGIDTSKSIFYPGRFGTYYLPKGSEVKYAGVIYDRAGSSFAQLKTGVVDWTVIFEGINWFHFSAICPAVSQSAADVCLEALQAAKALGITTSVDLNYRAKLWQYGKKPGDIMPALVEYCDVVMGNIWAAETMLNMRLPDNLPEHKADYIRQSAITAKAISDRFPAVTTVANTFRFGAENDIVYYTTLHTQQNNYVSAEYRAGKIVDKVGSGDCFMAGLIYGALQSLPEQEKLELATAAAFSMLFLASDATDKSMDDIKKIMQEHAVS